MSITPNSTEPSINVRQLFAVFSFSRAFDAARRTFVWRSLFLELVMAVSMCAAFYFLMRGSPMALVRGGDTLNYWVFSSCSLANFHFDDMSPVWGGRFLGMFFSGFWLDLWDPSHTLKQYSSIFALYHTCWLFLLFLAVTLSLRHALLINLGIFAGMIYYFSPAAGYYFYPWDIPATLFFTLGIIFFEQKQPVMMALAILIGCLFKETVLVCALLLLFYDRWNFGRRLLMFIALVASYAICKKMFLAQWSVTTAAFSMNNSASLTDLLSPAILKENLDFIFVPKLNNVFFVNAGTLVAAAVLCWGKAQRPYLLVILAFSAALLYYGSYREFRVFMQVLPPCLILLTHRWRIYEREEEMAFGDDTEIKGRAVQESATDLSGHPWSVRPSVVGLGLFAMGVVVMTLCFFSSQIYSIGKLATPEQEVKMLRVLTAQAENGVVQAQFQLAKRYLHGREGVPTDPQKAFYWYERAATNTWITAPEIIFSQESLGKMYQAGQGVAPDKTKAYTWLGIAALNGSITAQAAIKNWLPVLTPSEHKIADEEIQQYKTRVFWNKADTNSPPN